MPAQTFEKRTSAYDTNSASLDYLFYLDVKEHNDIIEDYFIPNGRYELIVDLGDPVEIMSSVGKFIRRPTVSLVGHSDKSVHIRCTGSHFKCVGAMIAPGKLSSLFGDKLQLQHGSIIDLGDMIRANAIDLVNALHIAPSPQRKIQILDDFINSVTNDNRAHPAFLDRALQIITQTHGKITVADLSRRVNCSSRHLRRTFIQHFGIGPKIFSSIIRLHDTVGRLVRSEDAVADIISDGGYFDRAHFYKEFIRIVGMKPGTYFKHQRMLSRNFFSEVHSIKQNRSITHQHMQGLKKSAS